jgi:hypothetical protein
MNLTRLLLAALLVLLAGCGAQGPAGTAGGTPAAPATAAAGAPPATAGPAATAAAPTEAAPTSVSPPTAPPATAAPEASPTADVAVATLTAELSATVTARITPVPTSESSMGGIEGANVLALTGGQPLWAVHSYGMRSFDPDQRHFVAIYSRQGDSWRELGRVELENADYLDRTGVEQVAIAPGRTWVAADSGVGAHGGCYDLLSFDGKELRDELSHCHDSPGAAYVQDIDGDGQPDVVLNNTVNYVFCYACGVRLASFEVRRWDGQTFAPVKLEPLPQSAPAELRELTNRAVAQAEAGFWMDAQATISQTAELSADDPTYRWDAGIIRLTAGARGQLAADSAYPLLGKLFFGDYPGALDALRQHPPEQLFAPVERNPLVVDTVADGFVDSLTYYITDTTTLALGAQPDLAAAHFLRGWALHLHSPSDPAALAEIERAAQLDPKEALYERSAAFLKTKR